MARVHRIHFGRCSLLLSLLDCYFIATDSYGIGILMLVRYFADSGMECLELLN